MKNTKKIACSLLAASALTFGLVGCGSSAKGADEMKNTYTGLNDTYIEEIGWYSNDAYTLETNADSSYTLTYRTDMFGGEDLENKGSRVIIYTGKYTEAASADGEASHKDLTLEAPTRMYLEQHGKGWGRNCPIVLGTISLDSANWTDAMTTAYDPENNAAKGEDFLAKYAHEMTVTVEDPTVDAEDSTLAYRLVTLPELNLDAE